jgi:hypothetical protein
VHLAEDNVTLPCASGISMSNPSLTEDGCFVSIVRSKNRKGHNRS